MPLNKDQGCVLANVLYFASLLIKGEPYVHALGALSGAQAVQQVAGGAFAWKKDS
jgi:isocitrate lyase